MSCLRCAFVVEQANQLREIVLLYKATIFTFFNNYNKRHGRLQVLSPLKSMGTHWVPVLFLVEVTFVPIIDIFQLAFCGVYRAITSRGSLPKNITL